MPAEPESIETTLELAADIRRGVSEHIREDPGWKKEALIRLMERRLTERGLVKGRDYTHLSIGGSAVYSALSGNIYDSKKGEHARHLLRKWGIVPLRQPLDMPSWELLWTKINSSPQDIDFVMHGVSKKTGRDTLAKIIDLNAELKEKKIAPRELEDEGTRLLRELERVMTTRPRLRRRARETRNILKDMLGGGFRHGMLK